MKIKEIEKVMRRVLAEAKDQPEPGYYNLKQAGTYLGLSPHCVQKWKDAGMLEHFQPVRNGTVRYSKLHLDNFMRRRESQK